MSSHPFADIAPATGTAFAIDAQTGLARSGQKRMPPKYLYDALGSTLFEAITQVPEYGLCRAERSLLETHAADMAALAPATTVIELGSGSATKSVLLLRALLRQRPVTYCAIDVSSAALDMTRQQLAGLINLRVRAIESEYLPGLHTAMQGPSGHGLTLVLLLGSSLGNLDFGASVRFLRQVRQSLRVGDHLLLGTDLIKPEPQLLAAYDDALGVTAAFNRNLLVRMNRELGTDFALAQFAHHVRFNRETHDVEMHLKSLIDQTVRSPEFAVTFRAGESIHTESSHKYSLAELDVLAQDCGFRSAAHWIDDEGQFASNLWVAV